MKNWIKQCIKGMLIVILVATVANAAGSKDYAVISLFGNNISSFSFNLKGFKTKQGVIPASEANTMNSDTTIKATGYPDKVQVQGNIGANTNIKDGVVVALYGKIVGNVKVENLKAIDKSNQKVKVRIKIEKGKTE